MYFYLCNFITDLFKLFIIKNYWKCTKYLQLPNLLRDIKIETFEIFCIHKYYNIDKKKITDFIKLFFIIVNSKL